MIFRDKPKFIFLSILIVAFLILILYWAFNENKSTDITIFLAAKDIPAGVLIRPEMLIKTQIPSKQADWKAINDFQEISGLTTLVLIRKDEIILYNHLSPTAKALGPTRSSSPQNYILTFNESTGVGKLFKPGSNLYIFGKASDKPLDIPLAVFPNVELNYKDQQTQKTKSPWENPIHLFSITPSQAESLKKLGGQSLRLFLDNPFKDEILDIFSQGST